MEPLMFTEVPFWSEGHGGTSYWTNAVPTCELNTAEGKESTTVVEYGFGETFYCRSELQSTFFNELMGVITRVLRAEGQPPWRGSWSGFWTLSEKTVRDEDDYVELFTFGPFRMELRVDGLQGPVNVGTADVTNILSHVYDILLFENPRSHFKYIPIEGELIYRELLDPIAPTHRGLPPRRKLHWTCDQGKIIPWRLSRNLDYNNILYELEIKAQVHPRDPRYGLDFICNPDRSAELERDEDELATAMYLAAASGASNTTPSQHFQDPRYRLDFMCNPDRSPELERQEEELATTMYLADAAAAAAAAAAARNDTPARHIRDPLYQLDYNCNPTNEHTGTSDLREINQTVERDIAIQAGCEDSYHQQQNIEQAFTHSTCNEEDNVLNPSTSYDYAYDRHGHNPDGVWSVIQYPGIQQNLNEFGTPGQQDTTPAGYAVSELSQSYEDSADADAVSVLDVDDYRGTFHDYDYVGPPPPPSPYPVYDTPEFDWFISDLGVRAADAYLMQLRGQYEDGTGGVHGQPGGAAVVDSAADSPPPRDTYDLPRRPVPNRSGQQPGSPSRAGPARPDGHHEGLRPGLSRWGEAPGHQVAEMPRREEPVVYLRDCDDCLHENLARHRARMSAWDVPPPRAHARGQLLDRGRRATKRLFWGIIGR